MKPTVICTLFLSFFFTTLSPAQDFILLSQNFEGRHIDNPLFMVRMSFEQGVYWRMIKFSADAEITSPEFHALIPKGNAMIPTHFKPIVGELVAKDVVVIPDQLIAPDPEESPLYGVISYVSIDESKEVQVHCQIKVSLEAKSPEAYRQNPRLTHVEIAEEDKFLALTASEILEAKRSYDENLKEWSLGELPPPPPMPPASTSPSLWESQHHNISVSYKPFWQLRSSIDSAHLVQAEWMDNRTGSMYILEKYQPTEFMAEVPDKFWYNVFAGQFLKNLENTTFVGRKSVTFRDQDFEELTFKSEDGNWGPNICRAYIKRTKEWVYKVYFIYSAEEEEIPAVLRELNEQMKWE